VQLSSSVHNPAAAIRRAGQPGAPRTSVNAAPPGAGPIRPKGAYWPKQKAADAIHPRAAGARGALLGRSQPKRATRNGADDVLDGLITAEEARATLRTRGYHADGPARPRAEPSSSVVHDRDQVTSGSGFNARDGFPNPPGLLWLYSLTVRLLIPRTGHRSK